MKKRRRREKRRGARAAATAGESWAFEGDQRGIREWERLSKRNKIGGRTETNQLGLQRAENKQPIGGKCERNQAKREKRRRAADRTR